MESRSGRRRLLMSWDCRDRVFRRRMREGQSRESEVELQRELEDARVVARGDYATEVARIEDPPGHGVNFAAGGKQSVEVADRIGKIRVIEQIEEFSAKFEIARFGQRKELCNGKIQIHLSRAAQTVAAYVPDICAQCAGCRHATGTGNWLAALHGWPGKDRRVEESTCGYVLICVAATHSGHEAGTSERACSVRQSIE